MEGSIPFPRHPDPVRVEPAGAALRRADAAPAESLVPAGCDWPIVLGIDPGTQAVGYGALVLAPDGPRLLVCGVIRPPRRLPIARRLDHIREGLERVLASCRPGVVAVESAFAARNVHSALRIGESRGVILACSARAGADVFEYAPATAKRCVAGNGRASKEQVAAMVLELLRLDELAMPSDATDALSLALTHVRRLQLDDSQRSPRP